MHNLESKDVLVLALIAAFAYVALMFLLEHIETKLWMRREWKNSNYSYSKGKFWVTGGNFSSKRTKETINS